MNAEADEMEAVATVVEVMMMPRAALIFRCRCVRGNAPAQVRMEASSARTSEQMREVDAHARKLWR